MAGTFSAKAKRLLIDIAAERFRETSVESSYAYPGDDSSRELIHGANVTGSQSYPLMRGTGRYPRDETVNVRVCVVVTQPGADPFELEERAVEIGTQLEEAIADDPGRDNFPGLISIGVESTDLDSFYDDGQASAVLVYDFAVKARLR